MNLFEPFEHPSEELFVVGIYEEDISDFVRDKLVTYALTTYALCVYTESEKEYGVCFKVPKKESERPFRFTLIELSKIAMYLHAMIGHLELIEIKRERGKD